MAEGKLDIAIAKLFSPPKNLILLQPSRDKAIPTLEVPLIIARPIALLGVACLLAMATLSMCLQH